MEEEYDEIASYHYSTFRPPLHEVILERCLKGYDRIFPLGLDVGCGTGTSSIALSNYCKKVIGIEPSKKMLQNSTLHPKIEYQLYATKNFSFADQTFDIVTFAGSLYYAKSQNLLNELIRVCKNKSLVIAYDFQIELKQVLQYLSNAPEDKFEENYNHEEDFSGLNLNNIMKRSSSKEHIKINLTITNLIHLLLSSTRNHKMLSNKFGLQNLEKTIHSSLQNSSVSFEKNIQSIIYYTIYEVKK